MAHWRYGLHSLAWRHKYYVVYYVVHLSCILFECRGDVKQIRFFGGAKLITYLRYIFEKKHFYHIRSQTEENWASRPLCHTQASDRQVSSWVGDHQRIPAVVCFCCFHIRSLSFSGLRRARYLFTVVSNHSPFMCPALYIYIYNL
jgi:hypothetical protein